MVLIIQSIIFMFARVALIHLHNTSINNQWVNDQFINSLTFPRLVFPFWTSSPEALDLSWESMWHREETPMSFWISQREKPLFLDVFLLVLYFILGKVWEPPPVAPQLCSAHRGSVWVAWLVVALCKRTEIFWDDPVIRVMDWVSIAGCVDVTDGNSNTSSSSKGENPENYKHISSSL